MAFILPLVVVQLISHVVSYCKIVYLLNICIYDYAIPHDNSMKSNQINLGMRNVLVLVYLKLILLYFRGALYCFHIFLNSNILFMGRSIIKNFTCPVNDSTIYPKNILHGNTLPCIFAFSNSFSLWNRNRRKFLQVWEKEVP